MTLEQLKSQIEANLSISAKAQEEVAAAIASSKHDWVSIAFLTIRAQQALLDAKDAVNEVRTLDDPSASTTADDSDKLILKSEKSLQSSNKSAKESLASQQSDLDQSVSDANSAPDSLKSLFQNLEDAALNATSIARNSLDNTIEAKDLRDSLQAGFDSLDNAIKEFKTNLDLLKSALQGPDDSGMIGILENAGQTYDALAQQVVTALELVSQVADKAESGKGGRNSDVDAALSTIEPLAVIVKSSALQAILETKDNSALISALDSINKSSGSDQTSSPRLSLLKDDSQSGLDPSAPLVLQFSDDITQGIGKIIISSLDGKGPSFEAKADDSSVVKIEGRKALISLGAFALQKGKTYACSVDGTPFLDSSGNAWSGFDDSGYRFSTSASKSKDDSNGGAKLSSDAGTLQLRDDKGGSYLDFTGDSAAKTLADLTSKKGLSAESQKLLDRYTINRPDGSKSKASASDASFIDFTVSTGSLKSVVAEVALQTEVKGDSYVKVNPNTGESFDFTYDPTTGQGAELLDLNKNGLVDTLRIHIQDGGKGDVDGIANGQIRDPGQVVEGERTNVYRFYRNGVHFYTDSAVERDSVIHHSYGDDVSFEKVDNSATRPDTITGGWGYHYEGVAYQALTTQGTALYRFFSPGKGYHFVTTNQAEAENVIKHSVGSAYDLTNAQGKQLLKDGWGYQFEGNTYKVSTTPQVGVNQAVYRFFNAQKGVHFYSSSLVEAESVIKNSLGAQYANDIWVTSTAEAMKQNPATTTPTPLASGWGYSFEGISWYV